MNTLHPILALLTNTSSAVLKPQSLSGKVYRCPTLQTFTIQGADATAFLQGQLTQDIAQQTSSQAQFAGYCTAQGRVLATLVIARDAQTEPQYRCFTHASVAQALIKRLRMFVMRSKVVITETTDSTKSTQSINEQVLAPLTVASLGIVGVSAADAIALEGALKHTLPRLPWQQQEHATGTWVCAPSALNQPARWWWLASAQHQPAIAAVDGLAAHLALAGSLGLKGDAHQTTLDADHKPHMIHNNPGEQIVQDAQDVDVNLWQQLDVQAGLPWVEQATQDLFIAQTLNLDVIGAVSFTKGCYPGQEVVARSHYRGTLKRRMFLGHIDHATNIDLASDVFSTTNPNEPCGRIMNSVVTGNRTDMLFESTLAAATENGLYLPAQGGELENKKIVIDALPYSLEKPTL
jgi:folate-binding protein YgfZ